MKPRPLQKLQTNGISVRAVVEGDGPLCILVHGWPESWYSWRRQIDPLVSAGYRVCVPDVRGYGESDKPQAIEAYDMRQMTGDVAGLVDALGEKQAILVGHDWGAPIVWNTSLFHPQKVRAVVGLSVPYLGRGPMSPIDLFRLLYKDRFFYQIYFQEPGVAERELEADVRTALRKVYFAGSGEGSETDLPLLRVKPPGSKLLDGLADPTRLPAWLTEQDLDFYTGEFERSGFRGPLNRYRTQERDWAALAGLGEMKITQPALFVAGERDPVLAMIPGVNLLDRMDPCFADLGGKVVLERAGHWIQQERPEEVNRAVLGFLKTL